MLKSLFPWKHHKTKAMAAQQTMDDEVPEVNIQKEDLLPCRVCGRTFFPVPLRKHERICEKTSTRKRKPFDSLKQRVEGTDLANFHQKTYLKKPETAPVHEAKRKPPSNWKEKHLALVCAIRAAKGVPIPFEVSSALPKTKSTTALMAGTERCPSCDRQFGPKAYDRHVEWCREKKAQQRIHHSPANVLLAKERLEARTKYVPPLNRTKKSVIRDKYSGQTVTENLASVSPLSRGPSVRKPRPVINVSRSERANTNNNDDRREKLRGEKNVPSSGDKGRAHEHNERHMPVIGSPSSKQETMKNSQKKRTTLPFSKINNVSVNDKIGGLTVSSLVYDSNTKKMVTWKDTVRKGRPKGTDTDTLDSARSSKVGSGRKEKVSKSQTSVEVACKTTQSERLQKESKKIQCEKILSCSDILHKNLPKTIPLSKYSFKSKLNLPVKENSRKDSKPTSPETCVVTSVTVSRKSSISEVETLVNETEERRSCISEVDALENTKMDEEQDLKNETMGFITAEVTESFVSLECDRDSSTSLEPGPMHSETYSFHRTESILDVPISNSIKDYKGSLFTTKSDFNCFRSNHAELTDWYDNFMKKAESADCIISMESKTDIDDEMLLKNTDDQVYTFDSHPIPKIKEEEPLEEEEKEESTENLVLLFKSNTNLTLNTKISNSTVEEKKEEDEDRLKKEVSEESLATNFELDSIDLNHRKTSHFSLKKCTSDVCVGSVQSGLSSKTTLVSLYWNKNREASDEENLMESKKISSSLPNIQMKEHVYKDGVENDAITITKTRIFKQKEFLRRKILEIAAKEFVQDCLVKEKTPRVEETSSENSLLKFLDEEYTVPKKRRRIENRDSRFNKHRAFKFSIAQDFDLAKLKKMTNPKPEKVLEYHNKGDVQREAVQNTSSEISSLDSFRTDSTLYEGSNEYSPRIFAILDNVLNTQRFLTEGRSLLVMTASDCRRLIDLDKEKLPELQRRIKKIKKRQQKQCSDLKLPPIVNKELVERNVPREDKEVQVEETLHLPRIVDKKLRRRENLKKVDVDIKKDVGNVYFDYDGERNNFGYNPFESAQRQFMELLECDDFKTLTPTCTPVEKVQRPHTTDVTPTKQPSPSTNKKSVKSAEPVLTKVTTNINRASVIEPPTTFKDSLDSIADDFELMENLINDNFTDDNKNNTNGFFLHLKSEKESLTLSDILNNSKYSDDLSIDPMLINENDNLSIPEHFRSDDYSPTSTTDTDITIQNDVDPYSVQYDNKIAAIEPKFEKPVREKSPTKPKVEKKTVIKRSVSLVSRAKLDESPVKVTNKRLTSKSKLTSKSVSSVASSKAGNTDKKKGLSSLKRSMTLFDPSPKPPSLKNKSDVDKYFLEQEQRVAEKEVTQRNSPPKEFGDLLDDTLKPEDLFNVDDEMYEEYKKYEEMYLKEKAQNSATKKHKPKIDINLGVHTASEEEDHSPQYNSKICNDSAYGSLTRKTPKLRSRATKLTPVEQKRADSTSSSGSEHCPNSPAAVAAANQRFSKFCHECGNKYPLMTAKFCVECGVKRLVL